MLFYTPWLKLISSTLNQNNLSAFERNDNNNKEDISEIQTYVTPNYGKSDGGRKEKGINIQQASVICPGLGQEYTLSHLVISIIL